MPLNVSNSHCMSLDGVRRNAIVKLFTLGLTALIEVWYASFLLSNLGVELYGLLPLATNILMFGSIISLTVISSLGRFVAIETHGGNRSEAEGYYSTGFFLISTISLAMFVASGVFSWYAPSVFKIPFGLDSATRLLLLAVLGSFIISFFSSSLTVGTFIYNRLDLIDLLNLCRVIFSRVITAALILFLGLKLNAVSLGLLSASCLTLTGAVVIYKKVFPEFFVNIKSFRKDFILNIIGFSGWEILRQMSVRSLIFADLFIVNHLYGVSKSGFYAVAFFFPSKLRLLLGPFAGLLTPVIVKRYADNDLPGILHITCQALRFAGIVFAFPVGALCGLYQPILQIWAGHEYVSLYWLSVILTVHIGINVSCYPLFSIQKAFNRIKIPAIFSCLMAGLYLLLAFVLGAPDSGIGMVGVAIAGALTLTVNHVIFNPFYTSLLVKASPWKFYSSFIPGIIGTIMTGSVLYVVQKWFTLQNYFSICIMLFAAGVIYCIIGWFCFLTGPEKLFIVNFYLKIKKINRFKG